MAGLLSSGTLVHEDCIAFPPFCTQINHGCLDRRCCNSKSLFWSMKNEHCAWSCNGGRFANNLKSWPSSSSFGSIFGGKTEGRSFSMVANCSGNSECSSVGLEYLNFDIVIVGAGIIGLTVARQFLSSTNLSVAIIDAQRPCAGATGAGQGYIWMGHRIPGNDKWELEKRSKQLWEEFVEELESSGMDPLKTVGWKKTGSLLVGATSEESVALQERVELLSKAGLRAEYLSASSLRHVEPALDVGNEGGAAFIPDDSQIDAKLAVSLIQEKNRAFASQGRYEEFFQEPAIRFLRSNKNGQIKAVQTCRHVFHGNEAVIVAAGAWSAALMEKLAEELSFPLNVPVKPRKGHLLVLESLQPVQLNHALMEIGYSNHQIASALSDDLSTEMGHSSLDSLSVSMTATIDSKGHLLLGSSRKFSGFDCQTEDVVVKCILQRAAYFLPALNKISSHEFTQGGQIRTGLRPYMPDGKPVIGPIPGLPKLILATGHEGAGLCMETYWQREEIHACSTHSEMKSIAVFGSEFVMAEAIMGILLPFFLFLIFEGGVCQRFPCICRRHQQQ